MEDRGSLRRDHGLVERLSAEDLRKASQQRLGARVKHWLTGSRAEPIPSFLGTVEDPKAGKLGVCCSGGGVRSAAFNLGALQALQEAEELPKADYLAAVSGGSYIAAAFAMVLKTWEGDKRPDRRAADHDDSDPSVMTEEHPPFGRGSPEEQYLRNRSSYLAPGLLGKLFLVHRAVMGMLFNLAFVALFIVAVGSVLSTLFYRHVYPGLTGTPAGKADAGACGTLDLADKCLFAANVPDGWRWTLLIFGGMSVALGLLAMLTRLGSDGPRRALETWAVRCFLYGCGVALVVAVVPVLVEVARNYNLETTEGKRFMPESDSILSLVGGGGVGSLVLAALLQLRARASEPPHVLKEVTRASRAWRKLGSGVRLAIAYAAVVIGGPALVLAILVCTVALTLSHVDSAVATTWIPLGSCALFLLLYASADLTSWSLHPFYRRRLCTAFALRRGTREIGGAQVPCAEERRFDKLVMLSETGIEPPQGWRCKKWPTLIVCAAANISDPGATPPGRGVTSFTFSSEALGGPLVGATKTATFEDAIHRRRRRDLTLPAAVAMSGAALSPSMGKQTHRPLTFLMALMNVRLGVWVPNPRRVASWRKRHPLRAACGMLPGDVGAVIAKQRVPAGVYRLLPSGSKLREWAKSDVKAHFIPRPRPWYLLCEMLGLNRVNAKFLYVTDGGHYENLGLVELLRRGCTDVYCFDASGGTSFTALGDAIALARSELCVEITIDPMALVPRGERNLAKSDCVIGQIDFGSGTPPGRLVYARTVMTKDAPWDVHAYHDADQTFPHNSTADQLYTDQKFEAYRALGHCAGTHAWHRMRKPGEALAVPASVFVPPPPETNGDERRLRARVRQAVEDAKAWF